MGQQEVSDFLKKHKPKWFTAREISKGLNLSNSSVTVSLAKLKSRNYIKYKESFMLTVDNSPRRCLKYRF